MPLRALTALSALLWLTVAPAVHAVELIMVEQKGCHYCIEWKTDLGPVYPKTSEGQYAPLRMVQIKNAPPEDVDFARPVNFTPTFVLVDNGQELGRIEGYPGEDFFWGLLNMLLEQHTDYSDQPQTN